MKVEIATVVAEFDEVAGNYEAQHAASITLSGEETTFFARYKVEEVRKTLDRYQEEPKSILDFGAGIGNSASHFIEMFPGAKIICADVSLRSLEICKERHGSLIQSIPILGNSISQPDNSVDVVFAACVFHHIDRAEHHEILQELRRVLRPGGSLFIFEHNPWNPLTQYAVARCSFDEFAVLINAPTLKRRVKKAGFADVATDYRIFFPGFAAKLRWLERYLTWLPASAQYSLHARA